MSTIRTPLGHVVITPKGDWDSSTTYNILDLVYNDNNAYLAKQEVPISTSLENENYWMIMVHGGVGPTGPIGPIGETGPTGPAGTFQINSGIEGILPISNGGTGTSTAENAWIALGGGNIGKKNNLTASDIPNLNYLPLSGGTLTGPLSVSTKLTIKDGHLFLERDSNKNNSIYMVSPISNSTNTKNEGAIIFNKENNYHQFKFAYYGDSNLEYENYTLPKISTVSGTSEYKILTDKDIPYIKSIIEIEGDYLPLSGGTISGTLNIEDNFLFLKINNINSLSTNFNNEWNRRINFIDANNYNLGGIELGRVNWWYDDKNIIGLTVNKVIPTTTTSYNVTNMIGCTIDKVGNRSYIVDEPLAFCNTINALPLSGGTMTGTINLSTRGFQTPDEQGYYTNQYGNFVHTSTAPKSTFNICNNMGAGLFRIEYESGTVVAGTWSGSIVQTQYGGTGVSVSTTTELWTTLGGGNIGKKDTLSASDIPNLSTSKITSGTLPIARGGTGATTAVNAWTALGGGNIGKKDTLSASDIPNLNYLQLTGGTLTGSILNSASGGKWIRARDTAALKVPSASTAYKPVISMAGANGDWSIGRYATGGSYDSLSFSYALNTNYDLDVANSTTTNVSYKVLLPTSGDTSTKYLYAGTASTTDPGVNSNLPTNTILLIYEG